MARSRFQVEEVDMKRCIKVFAAIALAISVTACAAYQNGEWRNLPPLPPSGSYASG